MKKDIKVEIFNREFRAYERWFKREKRVYYMELKALKRVLRGIKFNKALEVGVGSGRFAPFLNIKYGIEPSRKMRYIASKREIKVIFAKAQKIPFKNNSFDLVLMVTTICFLDNPLVA
ncbi:MAG: class I SAM-dependent methyltransferase, partial [Epsilonproteobacteria bacterium]|nr:class I SAM-dependent methyltransferase [Campylobacterota bacterium]